LAREIVDLVAGKLAEDVLLLDVRPISSVTDYFVICSAGSERQVKAIHDDVLTELRETGLRALHSEGAPESGWVLMDYGAVVVHIFSPTMRRYYDLEELWREAKTVVRML
jgi:ribosome-associated protein